MFTIFITGGTGCIGSVTIYKLLESPKVSKIVIATRSNNIALSTDKKAYFPNENIKIDFKVHPAFATSAWIGILPNDCPHGSETVNDENDLAYKYLKYKKYNGGGSMVLKAPKKSGTYDIRMHNTTDDGYEVASVTIMVK